ncbi:MAG: hypothetical protein ACOX0U_00935 [Oscillospiraceae bacterium]|jgi:hypothetical protein
MKGRTWLTYLCSIGLVVILLAGFGTVLAQQGGADDPLVTLSYLNNQLTPSLLQQVDSKLEAKSSQLSKDLQAQVDNALENSGTGETTTFQTVSLASGKTLRGKAGTEVLLRSGTGACVSSASPGLLDLTAGTVLENGKVLTANRLYLMIADGKGVKAGSAVTLLVRGGYSIS